jgi:hypothetical protein
VWDAVAQTDGSPAQSFEFLLNVRKANGSWEQSADVTNVNPAFTAKTRTRQTYAATGTDSSTKYGDNLTLSFDVEAIRDGNGGYQPFLQDLLDASKANGVDNLRRIQAFDALGADYALEADFAISASRTNAGWDDAGFFTITATKQGAVEWIDNPVLVGNVPIIESVNPASAAGGTTLVIVGRNFTGASTGDVKFGSTPFTSINVLSDDVITAVVPGTGDSTNTVTVHTPVGTSQGVPFHRTA